MPKLDLVQGSTEWKEARRKLVTATDASSIMGVGFKTPYQTWLQKISGEDEPDNERMKRGRELEPQAREIAEKKLGVVLWPEFHINPRFDWMAASLDGISKSGVLVEIKCPNFKVHEMALEGQVPDYYMPQLQHQMEVVGVDRMFYFSYMPDHPKDWHMIEVKKGNNEEMIEKEMAFYECLQNCIPPEFTEEDCIDLSFENEFVKLAESYVIVEREMKYYEQEKEEIRKKLCSYAKNHGVKGGGIKIARGYRKGNVDYSSIPELNSVDLEKYRKKPLEIYRISIE